VTRRGWFLFGALCVIWGFPYLLIKVAVRDLTPATLVFLRTTIGAALLLPIAVRRGQLRRLLPRWRPVVAFTAVEIAMPWLLLSDAERRLSSSLTGLFIASVPLVGAAIAWKGGGQDRFEGRRLAGLVLGLVGVVALLGLDVRAGDLGAVAELALVVIGYALGPRIVSRQLADVPGLEVVAVSLALCAIGYAPVGVAQLPGALPPPSVIASVVALGVVCTALAFLAFFGLIAEVGPVRSVVIAYVNPAVAVAAGVALLGEPFTAGTAVGFVLILAGSFLATRPAQVRGGGAAAPASEQPLRPAGAGR
jgi:drug/metabolite transporter (DMT)-like permease